MFPVYTSIKELERHAIIKETFASQSLAGEDRDQS